jgi:hypothetical protein
MMTDETIAQARNNQIRLASLANELAAHGMLAAAEIVAGGALSLSLFIGVVAPPEIGPEPAKEPARLEAV